MSMKIIEESPGVVRSEGFVVHADTLNHEVYIRVRWEGADTKTLQEALTNAYASAFAEVEKRLGVQS